MTDSSNVPLEYLYASNANVSNVVSMKLSGEHNYHIWKKQILCLMKSHIMVGLVDDAISGPRTSSREIIDQYDSLLSSWIFSSVSEDLLVHVIHLDSAKEVWRKLKDLYDQPMCSRIDPVPTNTNETPEQKEIAIRNQKLFRATIEGHWWKVEAILQHDPKAVGEVINDDGETILHVVVGTCYIYFLRKLLDFIKVKEKVTEIINWRSLDGSTALHIAAVTGNTYAADLLFQINENLINTTNNAGHLPYVAAYLNHQFDTSVFLLKSMPRDLSQPLIKDHNLLPHVISAKQYGLALELLNEFTDMVNDEVLMAIARNFPRGLTNLETVILPSFGDIRERIVKKTCGLFTLVGFSSSGAGTNSPKSVSSTVLMILNVLVMMTILVYRAISLLIWIVYLPFPLIYFIFWKVAIIRGKNIWLCLINNYQKSMMIPFRTNNLISNLPVPSVKNVVERKNRWENAKKVLNLVCDKIDKSEPISNRHSLYKRPILEAACQNCYEVVAEILSRSPEAIRWKDESGYGIFDLAVIHHSEKAYKLLHDVIDHRSLCRTDIGSSKENILHLAGRLAPPHRRKTNAAIQLQQDLQLREETKKLVVPALMHQKNNFDETPDMVFTREHWNMVKEAEKWMKKTAQSCGIIAALIATIAFAAAITVPGGSNQVTGRPIFKEEPTFRMFILSDGISLFTSTTSLLMYLSILTAQFAEKDFRLLLPRQLVLCLYSLLVSTIGIMIAFSTAAVLLYRHEKPFILALVCGTFLLPIIIFSKLQLPLTIDFLSSRYK